jgi:acetate kinase
LDFGPIDTLQHWGVNVRAPIHLRKRRARANQQVAGTIKEIPAGDGKVKIIVIATDEEQEIVRQTLETIQRVKGQD